MIDAHHQSSINMFLRCGEQGRRRYLEGEIIPPGIAACRGTGCHAASKINLTQKILTGKDLPVDDLKDAARDAYVKTAKDGIYIPKDELPAKRRLLNEGLEDSLRCTEVYWVDIAPGIVPEAVEERFDVDMGTELPWSGTVDYRHTKGGKPRTGDLKTSAMKWPAHRAESEIQPVFYAVAEEKITGVRPEWDYNIIIARRNKEGQPTSAEHQPIALTVSDQAVRGLIAKVRMVEEMLRAGIFPYADPGSFLCSPQWCGFWYTCPGVGNFLPKKWI